MRHFFVIICFLATTSIAGAGGLECKYKNIAFIGGPDTLSISFPPGPAVKPTFNYIQLDIFEDYTPDGLPKYTQVVFDKDKKGKLADGKSMPNATFVAKSKDDQLIVVTITGPESQAAELGTSAGDYEGIMTHVNGATTHVFEITCFGLE